MGNNPARVQPYVKDVLKVFAFLCGTNIEFDCEASDDELSLVNETLRAGSRQYIKSRALFMIDILNQEPLHFNTDQLGQWRCGEN
jgi:hypothetical protein